MSTLYIQDLIINKEYYQCLDGHNVLVTQINVAKEIVHFQYDNKPENGGGIVRGRMNQIECNRYLKKIVGYDYTVINQTETPFKNLLEKYMRLVMSEESVSYLTCINDKFKRSDAPEFNIEEIEVLTSIEKEILKEFY